MTSPLTASRRRSALATLLVGLACAQAACNLGSLDYLQNGTKRDGGFEDGPGTSSPDNVRAGDTFLGTKPDGTSLDDTASEGPIASDSASADGSRLDAVLSDLPVDAQEDTWSDLVTDAFIQDTKDPNGGLPDATGPDIAVPDARANLDLPKPDIPGPDSFVPVPDSWGPEAHPDLYVAQPDSPVLDGPVFDTLPPTDGATSKPSVLLVVGAIPLGTGDTAIQNHLVANGYDVTPTRDNATITTITATVVVISRSVSSSYVGAKYRNVTTPVLVNEYNLFAADMGLVSGDTGTAGSTGATPGADSLDVQAAAGELAAGLSGTINVFKTVQDVTYGVPNAQAILVAALPGQTIKWPIFAYETGAQMYGLVAPARRVGFFFSQTSPPSLTANGWSLFDAAVAWLAKSK
jgi:hypothetical protein